MGIRWVSTFRIVGIGWYIGICIAGGAFAGYKIGQLVGGSGEAILTIVGLMVGLIVAVFGTYRMLKAITSDN